MYIYIVELFHKIAIIIKFARVYETLNQTFSFTAPILAQEYKLFNVYHINECKQLIEIILYIRIHYKDTKICNNVMLMKNKNT